VDRKAQTVILPIHGFAVPFHINTIKNVSKNDEGDFTYLRVNFQTPGQLAGKKEDTVRQLLTQLSLYLSNVSPLKIPTQPSSAQSHTDPQTAIGSTSSAGR
jgi:FACT complex subunit (SPT16/CDC68)